MTRPFRLEEDERRYFALRSEFFIRLAQSGAHTQAVHDIMRNFGKLEDAMFFEGVRQGMAAALLMPVGTPASHERPALTVHHDCYGAAATPLVRAEREHIDEMGTEHPLDHPWLSKDPLEFGPLTITEATKQYGDDLAVAPPSPVRATAPVAPASTTGAATTDVATEALNRLADGEDPASVFGSIDIPDEPLQDLKELPLDDSEGEPLHRPALLDRIRDILLRLDHQPTTWQDMILMLMRETRTDAAHLDGVMSTPMGMTVISQAGLFHLHPGALPEVKAVPGPLR